MEMPVKMAYAPELYAAVTSSLYLLFGSVGAAVQVGAVLAAGALSYFSRHRQSDFRFVLWGTALLAASLVVWGAAVAPVNAEWAQIMQSSSEPLPSAYARLRSRWEYGHVAAFVVWFLGYCALQLSLVRDSVAVEAGKNSMNA